MRSRIVVLSGAGMSAESGLKTYRENGGLWDNHRVEEVATPGAWEANPERVLIDPQPPEAPGFHVIKPTTSSGLLNFEKSCSL